MKSPIATKIVATLAAVAAVAAVAAPAAAQSYGGDRGRHDEPRYEQNRPDQGRYNLNQRQEQLNTRIERGIRNGSLSRSEARQLRREAASIARIEARYRAGGLSGWERADLDRRFDRLDAQVRHDRHDRDYGSGYRH